MVNYQELPLFPLPLVLYPEMPLPLHIFEPRYREMVEWCRENNAPFGVVLIQSADEAQDQAVLQSIGTTGRITQCDELPDGCKNIVVVGETRFRILETHNDRPYMTGRVEPFWEHTTDPLQVKAPFDIATGLFKSYLKALFAQTGRPLSALQLPQEPEYLSYAIASVLQIPLLEKQRLLELTLTEKRLQREIELLRQEIEAHRTLKDIQHDIHASSDSVTIPLDMQELSKFSSRN